MASSILAPTGLSFESIPDADVAVEQDANGRITRIFISASGEAAERIAQDLSEAQLSRAAIASAYSFGKQHDTPNIKPTPFWKRVFA